jgi:hypothetical protein
MKQNAQEFHRWSFQEEGRDLKKGEWKNEDQLEGDHGKEGTGKNIRMI